MTASAPAIAAETASSGPESFGPWSPGIESNLPREFLPLATVFRPENVETPFRDAMELSDFSGIRLPQIVLFRVERLVVHEVLIRVMADLSVPVGETYGDLGVIFRAIVTTILRTYVEPRLAEVSALLDAIRVEAAALLEREVAAMFDGPPQETGEPAEGPARPRGWSWRSWLGGGVAPAPVRAAAPAPEDPETRALRYLDDWHRRAEAEGGLALAACEALRGVVTAVIGHRGGLIRDRALLASLARIQVSNRYGSSRIGALIEPWIDEAVAREGYHRLVPQAQPVVMNVKGSSASGKSTIRPHQRALTGRLGLDWSDFALITPDVWRKFLLDYGSLGPARRYAGTLTGYEVEIVDAKLDRHMAAKASGGRISHLLIDRFRFDSFSADPSVENGSQLLTRFGHRVYMQFMITPPDATVERAWKRGEQFGRYKAVEDLLAHNVEAFTGMPRLFFTWALKPGKQVFFEFLDNSVPDGARPRTIAFGMNGAMNVLDVKFLLDIDRFKKIDIYARDAQAVYRGVDAAPERNVGFLRECVRRMATIRFADHATGRVYAQLDKGRLTAADPAGLAQARQDPETAAALAAAGILDPVEASIGEAETLRYDEAPTLGSWGGHA